MDNSIDVDGDSDADVDDGFEDDVAMLRDYCLIATAETGNEFKMHALIHARRGGSSKRLSSRRRSDSSSSSEWQPHSQQDNTRTEQCAGVFSHMFKLRLGIDPAKTRLEPGRPFCIMGDGMHSRKGDTRLRSRYVLFMRGCVARKHGLVQDRHSKPGKHISSGRLVSPDAAACAWGGTPSGRQARLQINFTSETVWKGHSVQPL